MVYTLSCHNSASVNITLAPLFVFYSVIRFSSFVIQTFRHLLFVEWWSRNENSEFQSEKMRHRVLWLGPILVLNEFRFRKTKGFHSVSTGLSFCLIRSRNRLPFSHWRRRPPPRQGAISCPDTGPGPPHFHLTVIEDHWRGCFSFIG